MKTVFWDTNILIDYYANRPGADAAQQMLRIANAKELEICSSVLTFKRREISSDYDQTRVLFHADPLRRQAGAP